MATTYRKYGKVVQITTTEKDPSKVRISTPRKRRDVYGARRLDNIRRTRKICVRRLLAALDAFGSPLLVTLTFKGDASDASYANDSLRTFQVRLRATYKDAQSLFIPELSPKGRIHFHGLLFNVPLRLGDTREGRRIVSYGEERSTRALADLWGEGYVDAVKTDGSERLAYYLAKYITKAGQCVLFNAMRMLRISHGFPSEVVIRGDNAVFLKKHYEKKSPVHEWEGENIFLGKITRKTYHLPDV
jgi:hypothetical protein